jgi:hypothetical protein
MVNNYQQNKQSFAEHEKRPQKNPGTKMWDG